MKKLTALILFAFSILTLAGCDDQLTAQADYIGLDAAKSVALEDAGVSASSATFSTSDLDRRNGIDYYQLEFVSDGQKYEYDVDAITGAIISRQGAGSTANTATQTTDPTTGQNATTGQSGTTTTPSVSGSQGTTSSAAITAEQAKAKALAHAGLTAGQVTFVQCKLDWDDGRQVYEVEFYTSDYKEYDYEIDAATGEVVQYDYDAEYSIPQSSSGGQSITAEQAKQKALSQVPGATVSDIYEFETDHDDGRIQYEGKILYNGMEYEFEIDGYSGSIRSWESQRWGS